MNWKMLAMIATIIGVSTGGGYYHGGEDEALRYFLLSVCGSGLGFCLGRLLTKGD